MLASGKDFWMRELDRILFVCTGNFYRSRFAEAVFNHLAQGRGLAWRAESRGFSPHFSATDLSPEARRALELRNIPLALTRRRPARLLTGDLCSADLVVCLNEAEHRPYLLGGFPGWVDRVTYWHIPDIDVEPSGSALLSLEQNVLELVEGIGAARTATTPATSSSSTSEF